MQDQEVIYLFIYYFRFDLFIFRERWREGDGGRQRERNTDQLPLAGTPLPRHLAHHPGICPDRELNLWPFSPQASTQSTEPHQPGSKTSFKRYLDIVIFSDWLAGPLPSSTLPPLPCTVTLWLHMYVSTTGLQGPKARTLVYVVYPAPPAQDSDCHVEGAQ